LTYVTYWYKIIFSLILLMSEGVNGTFRKSDTLAPGIRMSIILLKKIIVVKGLFWRVIESTLNSFPANPRLVSRQMRVLLLFMETEQTPMITNCPVRKRNNAQRFNSRPGVKGG
jgi:hypothetical protein